MKKVLPKTIVINPYLYHLSLFLLLLLVTYCVLLCHTAYFSPSKIFESFRESIAHSDFILFLLGLAVPMVLILLGLWLERYEIFSILKIKGECLELRNLWSVYQLHFEDIRAVGIDYDIVGGKKEFWIYFSCAPISMKYYHQIKRLKFTKETFRVKYSRNTLESLLYYMPPKLSRELGKHYSVILLHKRHIEE